MKKIIMYFVLLFSLNVIGQKTPKLIIDGISLSFGSDISLPYWVDEGKTVDLGVHASSISILEFNLLNNELQFNQVINLTSGATVPASKVWKLEAIGLGINASSTQSESSDFADLSIDGFSTENTPTIFTSPQTFTSSGSWIVPPGVTELCIEAWGRGGRGGNADADYIGKKAGGGGGGAYGYDCFSVTPGTVLTITINDTGSSVNDLIFSGAGQPGSHVVDNNDAAGGLGGSSTASYNISGTDGQNAGKGGNGGNGGGGGNTYNGCGNATTGTFPGGGGGGGYGYPSCNNGGTKYPSNGKNGGGGQVIIYF